LKAAAPPATRSAGAAGPLILTTGAGNRVVRLRGSHRPWGVGGSLARDAMALVGALTCRELAAELDKAARLGGLRVVGQDLGPRHPTGCCASRGPSIRQDRVIPRWTRMLRYGWQHIPWPLRSCQRLALQCHLAADPDSGIHHARHGPPAQRRCRRRPCPKTAGREPAANGARPRQRRHGPEGRGDGVSVSYGPAVAYFISRRGERPDMPRTMASVTYREQRVPPHNWPSTEMLPRRVAACWPGWRMRARGL